MANTLVETHANEAARVKHMAELANRLEAKKANKATTLAGYGIGDAYTKQEIDGKLSSTYRPAGTVTFAGLPTPDKAHCGLVYNVSDAFITTANFLEGADVNYPAGTNVAIVEVPAENEGEDPTYAYDAQAGFVDLSGLVEKETGKSLISDSEIERLGGMSTGANKVEAGDTEGTIKIDGVSTTVVTFVDDDTFSGILDDILGTEPSTND